MSDQAVIALGGMFIAALVWAVRIEGKVLAHDREIDQLRQDTNRAVGQLMADIAYIRQRIDQALQERTR